MNRAMKEKISTYDGRKSAFNAFRSEGSALAVNPDLEQWIGRSIAFHALKALSCRLKRSVSAQRTSHGLRKFEPN